MKHIARALPLFDEARLLDNSSRENPFVQIAVIKKGRRVWTTDPLPPWAVDVLKDIPA
jgi:hypothetical protein